MYTASCMLRTYFIKSIWTRICVGSDFILVQYIFISTARHLLNVQYVNSFLVFLTARANREYHSFIRHDERTASRVYLLQHARHLVLKSVYVNTVNSPFLYLKSPTVPSLISASSDSGVKLISMPRVNYKKRTCAGVTKSLYSGR